MRIMGNKVMIILFLSFFAQNLSAQDSIVKLSNRVSTLLIKDLTRYKFCVEELTFTKDLVVKLESKVSLLETLNENKDKQLVLTNKIVEVKDEQLILAEKEIRKQKTNKTLWKIGLVASLILNGYLIVK